MAYTNSEAKYLQLCFYNLFMYQVQTEIMKTILNTLPHFHPFTMLQTNAKLRILENSPNNKREGFEKICFSFSRSVRNLYIIGEHKYESM